MHCFGSLDPCGGWSPLFCPPSPGCGRCPACSPSPPASICRAGGLVLRDPRHIPPPPMRVGCVRADLVSARQGGEVHGSGHRACSLGCLRGGTGMGTSAGMVGQDGIPSLTPGQGSLSGLFAIVPWLWDRCLSPLRAEAQCYLIWKPALPQPCPSHEASVGGVLLQRGHLRCWVPPASPNPVVAFCLCCRDRRNWMLRAG